MFSFVTKKRKDIGFRLSPRLKHIGAGAMKWPLRYPPMATDILHDVWSVFDVVFALLAVDGVDEALEDVVGAVLLGDEEVDVIFLSLAV